MLLLAAGSKHPGACGSIQNHAGAPVGLLRCTKSGHGRTLKVHQLHEARPSHTTSSSKPKHRDGSSAVQFDHERGPSVPQPNPGSPDAPARPIGHCQRRATRAHRRAPKWSPLPRAAPAVCCVRWPRLAQGLFLRGRRLGLRVAGLWRRAHGPLLPLARAGGHERPPALACLRRLRLRSGAYGPNLPLRYP